MTKIIEEKKANREISIECEKTTSDTSRYYTILRNADCKSRKKLTPSEIEKYNILKSLKKLGQKKFLIIGELGVGKREVIQLLHNEEILKCNPNAKYAEIYCLSIQEWFENHKDISDTVHTRIFENFRNDIKNTICGTLYFRDIEVLPKKYQLILMDELRKIPDKDRPCLFGSTTSKKLGDIENDLIDDLYVKLREVTITLPPLKGNMDDIKDIFTKVIYELNEERKEVNVSSELSEDILKTLSAFDFKGNVSQFKGMVHSAYLACATEYLGSGISTSEKNQPIIIRWRHFQEYFLDEGKQSDEVVIKPSVDDSTKTTIMKFAIKHKGVIKEIAIEMGYSEAHTHSLINRWGLRDFVQNCRDL